METLSEITRTIFTAASGFLTAPLAFLILFLLVLLSAFIFKPRYNWNPLLLPWLALWQTVGLNSFYEGLRWFIDPHPLPRGTVEGGPCWGMTAIVLFIFPWVMGIAYPESDMPFLAKVLSSLTAITLIAIRYFYFS